MNKRIVYQWIGRFGGRYRRQFVCMIICILTTCFLEMLFPFVYSLLIDEIFHHKNISFLGTIFLLYLVLYAGMILISILMIAFRAYLYTVYVYDVKKEIFKKIFHLKASFLEKNNVGDMITAINNDSDSFLDLVDRDIYFVGNIIRFTMSITFIFVFNFKLGVISLFIIPIVVLVNIFLGRFTQKIHIDNRNKKGIFVSWIYQVFDGIREIRVMKAEKNVSNRIGKLLKEFVVNNNHLKEAEYIASRVNTGTILIVNLIVYFVAAVYIQSDQLTIGALVATMEYLSRATGYLRMLSENHVVQRKNFLVSMNRIIDILEETEEQSNMVSKELKIVKPQIVFNNVRFAYDSVNNVLNNFSLSINAAERIGIVGSSGSGKSTLINLLLGLYHDYDGEILVDQQDIKSVSLSSLRQNIAVVNQDNTIYSRTVRENIKMGNPDITDEQIWNILKRVEAYEFIYSLPNKLDTVIGKNGRNFSGGQIQRLCIARVLLRNPSILILDESTSDLDIATEQSVLSVLDEFNEITIILITHRASTLRFVDRIAVMGQGNIVGIGKHEELLVTCSRYKELFEEL